MLASATSTLHLVSQTPTSSQFSIGPADTAAQGAGLLAGVGAYADGAGNDHAIAVSSGGIANTVAQGGANGGAGLLVDGLGNDHYAADAMGDTTLSLVVDNGGSATCWTVTVTVSTGESRATGQGGASLGLGAMADGAGDDVRFLQGRGKAGAIAGVNTTFNCGATGNRVTATATSGPGTASGQGSAALGVAVLLDGLGNDSNTLNGRSEALASAVINGPGTKVETATATAGAGQTAGQGAAGVGVGLSADALGNDTYMSTASSLATRVTSAGTVATPGTTSQTVQGWGGTGAGWLLDLDGADTYTTIPAASAAANNACWSNGSGRGRDWTLLSGPPFACN